MKLDHILTEATSDMKMVVIYPGRFHPFHKGHRSVYDYLVREYGSHADVFIATSGKVELPKSPFTFDEKRKMMELTGIEPGVIVQTKVPYVANEIVERYDLEKTVVVYAVSEKDMAEDPRFQFPAQGLNLKKNGEPAHMQKWPGWPRAEPVSKHSYVVTVPTVTFKVMGEPATSATEMRRKFSTLPDDNARQVFIKDLFGAYSDEVLNIMKDKLNGGNTESETST